MTREDIVKKLGDGWTVAGYSKVILAGGTEAHSILLQKGTRLEIANLITNGNQEIGRNTVYVS
jgi:hypothetical protein